MAEIKKADRNRLRKLRMLQRPRTRAEAVELIGLSRKSAPFNSMPSQPKRPTKRPSEARDG